MAKRGLVAIVGLVAVMALLVAQPAVASTEVGNRCTGNVSEENITTISLANAPGNPLPATVPSAGVITRWSFSVVPVPANVLLQTLRVFRATGANQFQVVSESAPGSMVTGTNTFSTRLPVQAGDYLGYYGVSTTGIPVTVYCEGGPVGDRLGFVAGNATVGSTATLEEEEGGFQNPLLAIVEPDADNDGYGDETQDKCPQNAAVQTDCPAPPPLVTLSTSSLVKKGLVTVLITSNSQAPVTVAGVVKLGKGKTAKLSGGTQIVVPGTIAKFTLLFSKSLRSKLKALSPKGTLKLAITSTATNSAGQPSSNVLNVKLKGQAKPKPKKPRRQAKS